MLRLIIIATCFQATTTVIIYDTLCVYIYTYISSKINNYHLTQSQKV